MSRKRFRKVDIEADELGGVDRDNNVYGMARGHGGFLVTSSMIWAFRNCMTNPQSNAADQISYFVRKLWKTGTDRRGAEACMEVFGMDDAGVDVGAILDAYYEKGRASG